MKIKIEAPWFSAYQTFRWAKGVWGVGLDVDKIEKAIKNRESIELEVYKFKEHYIVSPQAVKEYAEKNKTSHTAKGTKLYVIPQTELKRKLVF
jgi:hypothetical protein